MSALAARRAAQAALTAENQAAPVPKAASKPSRKPTPPREPSATPSISGGESDASVQAEQSTRSTKRRKMDNKATPSSSRYFAAAEERNESPRVARRRHNFSPSAPNEEDDEVQLSSEGSSEEDEPRKIDESEGMPTPRTPWSGAPSPRGMEPGLSRTLGAPALGPTSSNFSPKEGVNVFHVKESLLAAAGIKTPGPGVVISLDAQDNLQIAGTFSITPLRQPLSLLSTTVYPSSEVIESHPVYAPISHPLPVLEAVEAECADSPALTRLRLPRTFASGPSRTIFLLQQHLSGIENLRGDIVPGFPNIWLDDAGEWGLRGVHPVLHSFPVPVYAHHTPLSWAQELQALESATESQLNEEDETPPPHDRVPVVLVKGPKRSGKSSLARAALNRLLNQYARVAWLECDLGQGEFGCGGVVGLWLLERPVLGPPFTHPRLPARAQFLGELSPQSCPDSYMAAIQSLITHYQYEVQYPPASLGAGAASHRRTDAVPLVVNTQGWVKGLGEDLMRGIEAAAEPSHVFAFETQEDAPLPPIGAGDGWTTSPVHAHAQLPFPGFGAPSTSALPAVVRFLEPAPVSPLLARYTAADMRSLSIIAYMHARLAPESPTTWDFSAPLLAVRPWVTTLRANGPIRQAFLLGEASDAIVPAHLPRALNSSLVALIAADPQSSTEGEVYVPGLSPGEDGTVLALALVRAVRIDETRPGELGLQLLTPLASSELPRVSVLAWNGALELPPAGMLDWRARVPGGGVPEEGLTGWKWDDVPFFDAADAGEGGVGWERRRFRRNLQRKGM